MLSKLTSRLCKESAESHNLIIKLKFKVEREEESQYLTEPVIKGNIEFKNVKYKDSENNNDDISSNSNETSFEK